MLSVRGGPLRLTILLLGIVGVLGLRAVSGQGSAASGAGYSYDAEGGPIARAPSLISDGASDRAGWPRWQRPAVPPAHRCAYDGVACPPETSSALAGDLGLEQVFHPDTDRARSRGTTYDDLSNSAHAPAPLVDHRLAPNTPGCEVEVLIDTSAVYKFRALVPLLKSRSERGVVSAQVEHELVTNKAPYPAHPFMRVPDAANSVAMARVRQQYEQAGHQGRPGADGDIIIGTTAISSGRRLYSSDRFLVAAVSKAGGLAEWVP